MILAFLISAVWIYRHMDTLYPKKIRIATGAPSGAYTQFALRYKALLAQEEITLEIIRTSGAVENLALLKADVGIDLAFVQGGVASKADHAHHIVSLGSVFNEPLWVFTQGLGMVDDLQKLKGKRIAVGPEGSGTHALAMRLLKDQGLTSVATFFYDPSNDAVERLKNREIDAAFFVASTASPLVRDLLFRSELLLVHFRRAAALSKHYPFLNPVVLPEGILDLRRNIPDSDYRLLNSAASLVVRRDLHPILIHMLLEVATKVHGPGDLLTPKDTFPSEQFVEFPLSPMVSHYYETGPPLLQRYFPFWLIALLDQLKIILLPVFTLLISMSKIVLPLYRWRMRSRIYRWYEDLQALEMLIRGDLSWVELEALLLQLKEIEVRVERVSVPFSYFGELYRLRADLRLVYRRIRMRQEALV
ncbi:TAXI family TRAP transporter solute-binding subunit [Magnetococcales bacterium HHB-1]